MKDARSGKRATWTKRLFCVQMTAVPRDSGSYQVEGDKLVVDLARVVELGRPGGAVRLVSPDLPDQVIVVRGQDDCVRAYRNRCACGGFRVDPVPGEDKMRCVTPMASTYDNAGNPLTEMVQRKLDSLPVSEDGGRLVIDIAALSAPPPHKRKDV
jgi:hypothetical protein